MAFELLEKEGAPTENQHESFGARNVYGVFFLLLSFLGCLTASFGQEGEMWNGKHSSRLNNGLEEDTMIWIWLECVPQRFFLWNHGFQCDCTEVVKPWKFIRLRRDPSHEWIEAGLVERAGSQRSELFPKRLGCYRKSQCASYPGLLLPVPPRDLS